MQIHKNNVLKSVYLLSNSPECLGLHHWVFTAQCTVPWTLAILFVLNTVADLASSTGVTQTNYSLTKDDVGRQSIVFYPIARSKVIICHGSF